MGRARTDEHFLAVKAKRCTQRLVLLCISSFSIQYIVLLIYFPGLGGQNCYNAYSNDTTIFTEVLLNEFTCGIIPELDLLKTMKNRTLRLHSCA